MPQFKFNQYERLITSQLRTIQSAIGTEEAIRDTLRIKLTRKQSFIRRNPQRFASEIATTRQLVRALRDEAFLRICGSERLGITECTNPGTILAKFYAAKGYAEYLPYKEEHEYINRTQNKIQGCEANLKELTALVGFVRYFRERYLRQDVQYSDFIALNRSLDLELGVSPKNPAAPIRNPGALEKPINHFKQIDWIL